MNGPGARSKPRLLVLASTYPRWSGDPEPGFVHELAKRLTDDFEVTVLGPHSPGAAREDVTDGVRVRRYRYAPAALETLVNDGGIVTNLKRQPWKWLLVPGFLLGLVWSLWRLSRQWRPDVIHAHWLLPQGLAVATLRRLGVALPPFLVTSHGADLYALQARPLQVLKRFVIREAAAVTVVSGAMRAELARIGAEISRVSVQPMGVDLSRRFTPDAGVERSGDEILFVGRLVEKKGLRHLIEAMPSIIAKHPAAFLTVAGFGPEAIERRQQVARLGLADKVRFVGAQPQDRLPGLYQRAAIFVAPFVPAASGDREGFGLVAIEAAGCGCPLILSRMPQLDDAFSDDHVLWAEPGDSRSIAQACTTSLSAAVAANARAEKARQSLLLAMDWEVRSSAYGEQLRAITRPPVMSCHQGTPMR